MILFDTSVWINHFNRIDTLQSNFLGYELQVSPKHVALNATILQEVLQGAKNDNYFDVYQDVLMSVKILKLDMLNSAIASAQLYRQLRKKGVSIRKPNDCLIAVYALHFNIEICHNDTDFDLIAAHSDLKIWKPI